MVKEKMKFVICLGALGGWPFLAGKLYMKKKWAAAVCFAAGTLVTAAVTIYYTHWEAYQSAVKHLEGQDMVPSLMGIICLGLMMPPVLRIIGRRRQKKDTVIIAGLLVVLAACIYSEIRVPRGCPACSGSWDNDVIYHFLLKLFTGKEFHVSG